MTPRDNFLSLYRRSGYQFAPVHFSLCPAMQRKKAEAIGDASIGDFYDYPEGFSVSGAPGPQLLPRETSVDWKQFYTEELHPETNFNAYGVAHEGGHEGTAHLWRMHHPMANFDSLEQLQSYPWPEWDWDNIEHIEKAVETAHAKDLPVIGSMACSIWETAWYIRDMTMLMMDMAVEDEKAVFLLDKITEHATKTMAALARSGVDLIVTGDDIGMQKTIMMSLDMYCEWIKPRYAKIVAAAKAENPDVLIHYHSCGYIEPYIPHLIEAGIDILNPIQPECMDFAKLHSEYGDIISFNGTIGTQTTMPFGTPAEVRETVFKNLDIAGEKGGLLVCPTHLLEPEVPWENVEAYILACRDYSRQ